MILPIIYPSAAEFWLDGTNRKRLDRFSLNKRGYSTLTESFDFYVNSELCNRISQMTYLNKPIHIIAPTVLHRRQGTSYHCKSLPKSQPANSFVEVACISAEKLFVNKTQTYSNPFVIIYVSSPEMCFLEAAKTLSITELIEFGYSLCARYIIDRNCDYFQRKREILTTRESIELFLSTAKESYGIQKARRAIKYVVDNSNSPIESKISMIFVLPYFMGGYGMGRMELNSIIYLSKDGAQLVGRDRLMSDMLFAAEKVAVEYDSNICHLDPEQHSYDKKRVLAMELSGYKVLNLTSKDIISIDALDNIAEVLRSMLGLRNNEMKLLKYENERKDLFNQLFK